MSVTKRVWANGDKSAWVVRYTDKDGKRRLRTFERKADADAFEATAKVEVRAGTHTADSASVTVAKAADDWINSGKQEDDPPLERTTLAQRQQHVDLHIKPFLGTRKLSQLTPAVVVEFQSTLRDNGRSPAMVKKVTVSLSSILSDAMLRGTVARNVVREMPKRKRSNRHKVNDQVEEGRDYPKPSEVKAIVAHLDDTHRPVILTALLTGLRSSELRGLDWADVDLDGGKLTVRQRADRYGTIGSPKSEAGARTVPMPTPLINTLRAHKLATGGRGLVFGGGNLHSILRGWWAAQIAAGLSKTTTHAGREVTLGRYSGLHAARHYYASWCINPTDRGGLGLDPKVVQTRLGHATLAMTMDTYGHLFPSKNDRAERAKLDKATAALFGAG